MPMTPGRGGAPRASDDDVDGRSTEMAAEDPARARSSRRAVRPSQRDEYLDDVRRARAEFENYRRRMTS
jgi:molecular chaperone GrpE (heat shock protein)